MRLPLIRTALLACALAGVSSMAQARVGVGIYVAPAPYYYPVAPVPYYYPPAYVVQPAPQAYVEQPQAQSGPPPGSWYYCDASHTYYPHVTSCTSGWREVPVQPQAH